MVLQSFVSIWGLLFVIFTWLGFSTKSIKVYLTGCLTSLLYFIGATELLMYIFHNKIPVVGALINPFPGTYVPLVLNFQYHWPYWGIAMIISLFFLLKLMGAIKRDNARPLAAVKA